MNNDYWIDNHFNLIPYSPYIFAVSTVVFLFIGWVHGRYLLKTNKKVMVRDELASTIFGLSALILGFIFVTAVDHYNQRTEAIRNEALSLDRVYASTKYLNAADQIIAKKHLKDIVDARLKVYQDANSFDDLDRNIDSLETQLDQLNEFITQSIARSPVDTREFADKTLRSRVDKLSDVFATAVLHAKNHPAVLLERFLFIQLIVSAMLCGYSMAVKKEEDWYLTMLYLVLMAVMLYVINCLEFPNQLVSFDMFNRELLRFQKLVQ